MEHLNELNIADDDFSLVNFDDINSIELLKYYKLRLRIAALLTTESEYVGKSFDNLGEIYNVLSDRKVLVKKPYHEATTTTALYIA